MPETNGNGDKRKLAMQSSRPALKSADTRERAIEMWLGGATTVEVAKALDCSHRQVHRHIARARMQLLAEKNDYFNEQIVSLLDQKLEALQEQAGMFADTDWLKTTEPERIHALGIAFGILWDKTAILLAAAGRHQRPALSDAINGDGNGRAGSLLPGASQTD